jgi:anti-anti-sigma regulatory factor
MLLQSRVTRSEMIGVERFPGGRVARFLLPDLSEQLYDSEDMTQTPLFQELRHRALIGLHRSESVVLNLGLVEPFPTVFYRFLLKVREVVLARDARLILCRLSADHREIFEITKGVRLFTIVPTEKQAILNVGLELAGDGDDDS